MLNDKEFWTEAVVSLLRHGKGSQEALDQARRLVLARRQLFDAPAPAAPPQSPYPMTSEEIEAVVEHCQAKKTQPE